jgi:hypothetical protein
MVYIRLHWFGFFALLFAGLGFPGSPLARGQALFDASFGTKPEAQGWTYAAAPVSPVEILTNDSVLLDTTASASIVAGWSETPAGDMNATKGFSVVLNVQINTEAHTSTNRAGFSVIVLDGNTNGVELGFWTNTIFAQSTTPAYFTRGESTNFVTSAAFVNYAVTIFGTNYVLSANGTNILSGPLRNYSAYNTFPLPDPYVIPNLTFFGDDTTEADASFNVRDVALILPPQLAISASGVVSWTGVTNQTYTVQASTNLTGTSWTTVGTATSQNGSFLFTNSLPQPIQFFRVVYP